MRTFPKSGLVLTLLTIFIFSIDGYSQTKKLKRPSSRVGVTSVDRFVKESFDLYDKVYMYDGYAEAGKPLSDEDIDVLEQALDDVTGLSDSAPDILSDIDGIGVLKQSKATLQVNRAKKALKYSIKTSKELLLNQREQENEEESESTSDEDNDTSDSSESSSGESDDKADENSQSGPKTIQVYSKFDFVPGDKVLFFEDFRDEFIGDFPSKWNTNGSGEVVTINDSSQKYLQMIEGYNIYFIPDIPKLPEDYTIEFDFAVVGIDNSTSSTGGVSVLLSDDDKFKAGANNANAWIPVGQYGAFDIRVSNRFAGEGVTINTGIGADLREAVLNQPHISIAVNKQRYRLWVNEKKYVDIPRMVPAGAILNTLKFNVRGLKDGKEKFLITNLKVAEGGVDLRRKLLSEGKISTNAILFDSGSANLQPQSMGIIRQIYQVLEQDASINLKIVGHTDSDGGDEANMALSSKRAEAVKNALVSVYGVGGNRLTTEGKGESEPVAENTSPEGKSQNRRVEFIKQ